jgi:zinc D-Ala-D-Ala carboxypeptidase
MNLSEHFTLEELTVSDAAARRGLDNKPTPEHLENLKRLAAFLEELRALLGKPILVNSAYRSKEVNDAVGGSRNSQHCLGCAADLRVPGMTPKEVVTAVINSKLKFDQVIEEFGSWTHISIPNKPEIGPRKQALIIDRSGTRPFKV